MNNYEIDQLVAEKVMGWEIKKSELVNAEQTVNTYIESEYVLDVLLFNDDIHREWNPSEDISDAWIVVEKLSKEFGVKVYQDEGAPCECDLHHWSEEPKYHGEAETAPMAICLAALESVGVEVPE
ncbi:hypothetical protein [Bacillus sp. REN10]|uniref:BC1872 family protein n=1 Tax=Bacillus sp. REN10 TaxID=2782541 RepID=UPI00193BA310|nr:hypothetical protein [Bacillus sp. REN10]